MGVGQFPATFTRSARSFCDFCDSQLQANAGRNFAAFCTSLAANIHTVIVDGPNIQMSQVQRYIDAAMAHTYSLHEVLVGEFTRRAARQYAARCGVPLDRMLAMLQQWWDENGGGDTDEEEEEDVQAEVQEEQEAESRLQLSS